MNKKIDTYKKTFMKESIIKKLILLINDYVTRYSKGEFGVKIYQIQYHDNKEIIEEKLHNVLEPLDDEFVTERLNYRKLCGLLNKWLHPIFITDDPITIVCQEDFDFLNRLYKTMKNDPIKSALESQIESALQYNPPGRDRSRSPL